MRYNYACDSGCMLEQLAKVKPLPQKDFMQVKSGRLVWEERHGMTEDPEIKCPICQGKATKTLEGVGAPVFYFPGNCYLNKDECRKQMDLHALESGKDPYASFRQPGEVDHIKTQLRKPKRNRTIIS